MTASVVLKSDLPRKIRRGTWSPVLFDEGDVLEDTDSWFHGEDRLVVPTGLPSGGARALLSVMAQWAPGTAGGQTLVQLARDPLTPDIDTTGTTDKLNTSGKDFTTLCWPIKVRNGQPVAPRVSFNDDELATRDLLLVEFKVWVP